MDTAALRAKRLANGQCPLHGTAMDDVGPGPDKGQSLLVCARKNCGIAGIKEAGSTQVSLTPEYQHLLGPVPVLTSKMKVPKAPIPKPQAEEIKEIRGHLFEINKLLSKLSGQQEGILYCSFCGNSQHEVRKLISCRDEIFICDDCVELCQAIVNDESE